MITAPLRQFYGIKAIDPSWTKIKLKDAGSVHISFDSYAYYDQNLVLQKLILEGCMLDQSIFYRETDYELQLDEADPAVAGRLTRSISIL